MKQLLFLTLFLAGLFQSRSHAQNSLYFMDNLPQRINYNPALIPHVKYYCNFPLISHIQADAFSTDFNINQVIEFSDLLERSNSDTDEFLRMLGEQTSSTIETRINLFDFGFNLKGRGFLSFSYSQRNLINIDAPPEILYLLNDYELIKDRLPVEIKGMNVRVNSFSQLAVTFSHKINDAITLGISPKLTAGIFGMQASNLNARLSEDLISDSYGEYLETEEHFSGEALIGLPVPVNRSAIKSNGEFDPDEPLLPEDMTFNFSQLFANPGFAFDAGITFDLNDKWSFSASLTDIGVTSWKETGYHFTFKDTVYNIRQDQPLKMTLPMKLYLAGSYNLSPRWNTGLVIRNRFYNQEVNTSTTLSLNGYVFRLLSATVSYTHAHSLHTLGGGLRLRFLPGMDIYAVSGNLSGMRNYKEMQHVNFAVGLNMAFGLKREIKTESEEI